jgi:hypothetical protein
VTKYVQIVDGKVVAVFAGPQSVIADKPGYAVIQDTDPAWIAHQTSMATMKSKQGRITS